MRASLPSSTRARLRRRLGIAKDVEEIIEGIQIGTFRLAAGRRSRFSRRLADVPVKVGRHVLRIDLQGTRQHAKLVGAVDRLDRIEDFPGFLTGFVEPFGYIGINVKM